jgi:hypothetical protein
LNVPLFVRPPLRVIASLLELFHVPLTVTKPV